MNGAGPTPSHYIELDKNYQLNDAKILHGLYGSLLGEGIGFTSQRKGSIYNNIIALRELQSVPNSSSGSTYDFGFHVEDAFHPTRAEYFGLVCMRNEEQVATIVSCIDGIELTPEERDILFQDRFNIAHNPIHDTTDVISENRQAIFFGHPERPYVRINAAALNIEEYDGLERQAITKVLKYFEKNRVEIVLKSTDCVYIDNYRCVHARNAYQALYGPNTRWLARVVFTSDLKKSRPFRSSTEARSLIA